MEQRHIIVNILNSVIIQGEHSNTAINKALHDNQDLDKQERAFISRVVIGTIERLITIDYIINKISKLPVKKMKPNIQMILRSSVYQIMFLDNVPDYAVVNEAVKLTVKMKLGGLKSFVNGVLRNIIRRKESEGFDYPTLEVQYSLPNWIIEDWIKDYNRVIAENIAADFLKVKPITVRLNLSYKLPENLDLMGNEESIVKSFNDIDKYKEVIDFCFKENDGIFNEKSIRDFIKKNSNLQEDNLFDDFVDQIRIWYILEELKKENVTVKPIGDLSYAFAISGFDYLESLESFKAGMFYIQDISSMYVAEVANPKKGDYIIDVCAAPGGKALHLAEKLKDTGRVEARDLTNKKIDLILENIKRSGLHNIKTKRFDALVIDEKVSNLADIVIADLPCSGLGIIGKKPDIKYKMTEETTEELAKLQGEILNVVCNYVKPKGKLVFSTCTINKHENEDNVENFLANHQGFKLVGMKQLLPGYDEGDGFFISEMIREF
ncbi:MAG: 16S rRNA (cytosine(967)-C(5))-methyltransferase RsmB [Lachnospiraceae bacterium]|nr:16S rRNA (cytosine(967)-C(5))-methyltransferase RsmB [Lachnospiraceae bacterium]